MVRSLCLGGCRMHEDTPVDLEGFVLAMRRTVRFTSCLRI